jgi:hypothetical protein
MHGGLLGSLVLGNSVAWCASAIATPLPTFASVPEPQLSNPTLPATGSVTGLERDRAERSVIPSRFNGSKSDLEQAGLSRKAKDLLLVPKSNSESGVLPPYPATLEIADQFKLKPFASTLQSKAAIAPEQVSNAFITQTNTQTNSGGDTVQPAKQIPRDILQTPSPQVPAPSSPGDPNTPPVLTPPPPACDPDPELGCILPGAQISTAPAARFPVMYLIPRLDFFSSSNILSGVDPVRDGLIRPSLSVLLVPQLGPRTFFIGSVEGSLNRYLELSRFDYDELRFRAGISHQLSPNMTGEIGWSNQQLFIASSDIAGFSRGKRFLNDQAARLEISRRDQLAKHLSLNSFYQLRVSFAKPEDRSRIINVIFLSLNYDPTTKLQLGLDYQFAAANFTQQARTDLYHQLLGRISYTAFRNTQLSVYGGFSSGTSTARGINFDGFLLGVSFTVNWTLF